jgi:hypothetical protein
VPLTTDTIKVVFNKRVSGGLDYFTNVFGSGWYSPGQVIFPFNSNYDTATNTYSFPVTGLRSLYTYKVLVGNGMPVFDLTGRSLEGPNSFTFTTADGGQPRVVGSDPAPSGTVDAVRPLRFIFSEALDPSTVNGSTFIVVGGSSGTNVPGTVSYDAATFSAVFTPSAPFRAGGSYTMRVADIRDATGVGMQGTAEIHITTH